MHAKLVQLLAAWILFGSCAAQNPTSTTSDSVQLQSIPLVVDGLGRITEVKVGGSGRFLVLRLEDSRLAIFDIVLSKIIGHVRLPTAESVIAAGKNVLVVIDPVNKRLERWSLKDAVKQSESTLDIEMDVGHAAIGAASEGPLLLMPDKCRWPLEEVRLLNVTTLKPMADEIDVVGRFVNSRNEERPTFVSASDDGSTFYVGPAGLLLRIEMDRVAGRFCPEIDWENPMQPGRLGRYLYGWSVPLDQINATVRAQSIQQSRSQGAVGQFTIHDHGGSFFLSMRPTVDRSGMEAFYATEEKGQLLGKVPGFLLKTDGERLSLPQRVHLHSRAGVIATVDARVGRITVHRIRPGDVLQPNDPRRLSLTSTPKFSVHAGQAFARRIQVLGRTRETKFELVGGPDGMSIDENGILRWLPPKLGKDMTIGVELQTSSGENMISHQLSVTIRATTAATGETPNSTIRAPTLPKSAVAKWHVDSRTIGSLNEPHFAKPHDESIKIKVGAKPFMIRPAAQGQLLVFREPGRISILSTRLAKLIAHLPAPHTGTQFATGRDCVVVHDPIDRTLTRWRLDDLTVSHRVQAPFVGEARLMLLGAASTGPLIIKAKDSGEQYMLDSESLELLPMPPTRHPNVRSPSSLSMAGIAENGTTLLAKKYNHMISFVPAGTEYQAYSHQQVDLSTLKMSSDGRRIYSKSAFFDRYWRPQDSPVPRGPFFPAISGPTFLVVWSEKQQTGSSFQRTHAYQVHAGLHLKGFPKPLSTMKNLPLIEPRWYSKAPDLSQLQMWFIPTINRLVRFDPRTIEFVIHYWDVNSALDRLGSLRPIIVSSPQIWVRRGSQWSYQLDSLPRGKTTYRMPVAPEGMKISKGGKITWDVPVDLANGQHRVVIVAASEYGKEENHAFDLLVLR